jgi:hypothetical protein
MTKPRPTEQPESRSATNGVQSPGERKNQMSNHYTSKVKLNELEPGKQDALRSLFSKQHHTCLFCKEATPSGEWAFVEFGNVKHKGILCGACDRFISHFPEQTESVYSLFASKCRALERAANLRDAMVDLLESTHRDLHAKGIGNPPKAHPEIEALTIRKIHVG